MRAVAIALVAVYHIWVGSVSGGVDVFLLLTGFLITGSLVRSVERGRGVGFRSFWARLLKRLTPSAAIVFAAVLAGAFLFLPRSRWFEAIADVVASALYLGNWHLAFGAVDYGAGAASASPLQHYWSLSVQGQFYLLWPVLVLACALISARLGRSLRASVAIACGAVFALSFGYSLWITATATEWAYFDTGARLWELALGGLLAIVHPYIRLPRAARVLAGWLGLAALVLCGAFSSLSDFPGYIALWPTAAAVLVLVSVDSGSRFGADRLLRLRSLTVLGGWAYAFYLWHWPILVFYLEVTERQRPSLTGGLYIIALALVLAAATTRLVDGAVANATAGDDRPRRSLLLAAAFLAPVVAAAGTWYVVIDRQAELREQRASDPDLYPGARLLTDDPGVDAAALPELPLIPDPLSAAKDSKAYIADCNSDIPEVFVSECVYGPETSETTLALVGSSHARSFLPTFNVIAGEQGWTVHGMTKSDCQFMPGPQIRSAPGDAMGEDYPECSEWNDNVMDRIEEIGPDFVVMLATRSDQEGDGDETVLDGYKERWAELDGLGIGVIAIRDTPRLGVDISDCVDREHRDECAAPASLSLADPSPIDAIAADHPNVDFVDLTDHLCPDGTCPGVVGNRLVYYDDNHFTYAFAESLAPVLTPYVLDAVGRRA